MNLAMLPLYEEKNSMRMDLGDEDDPKLQYLALMVTSSKMSRKSTCMSLIKYFDEGQAS